MKLFIIPSWYRTKNSLASGIFFKEQASLIAKYRPNWNLGMSCLDETHLLLKNFVKWPHLVTQYIKHTSPTYIQYSTNFQEYWNRYFFISERVWFEKDNFRRYLNKHEMNFDLFLQKEGSVDLIISHCVHQAGLAAQYLSELHHIPYLIIEHSSLFPESLTDKNNRLKNKYQACYNNATAVISVSNFLRKKMEENGIQNVRTIPNFIDTDFFHLSESNQANNKTLFFSLAVNISNKGKGISELLCAIRKYLDTNPKKQKEFEFRIAGKDDKKNSIYQLAKKLDILSVVRFLGPLDRDQVKQEMQGCDCFVLPSHYETFGCVYAEALSCGKPVIWTKAGGQEDFITPNQGISVDIGSIPQLSQAIDSMMLAASSYSSQHIRDDLLAALHPSKVIDDLEEIIINCVKRK